MKKLFFVAALIISITAIRAQVTQEWVQTYTGGNLGVRPQATIALDNAGNIYAAGSYYDGAVRSMLLLKYDAAGTLVWSRTYLPAGYTSASGYAVIVDGNADVIITGSASPGPFNNGFTRKYDATGQLLWSQTANFSSQGIATDENNNVYITSWDAGGYNLLTTKYNSSGVQQWTSTYTGPSNSSGAGKIIYKDGYVYRTGQVFRHLSGTPSAATTPVVVTLKYDAANGAQVWAATYSHADKISQGGSDLVVDGVGNTYVTGFVYNKAGSNQNINWVTLKYNSAGTQQWVKFYDGNANDNTSNGDYPNAITMDNSNNIIVTGASYTTTGQFTSQDMTTIKYSSAGSQVWVKTYDGPAHGNDDAKAITSDASSNIYITGTADATTIKYNSAGTMQWTVNYSGGSTYNVRLDNSGNVYAGGSIPGSSLLIKYSQGGALPFTKMANPEIKDAGINVLKLYPSPATNQITLNNGNDKMLGIVSVYDASGKMVYQKFIGNSQTVIDVRNFPSGVYYLRSDQIETAIKFVKQ